MKKKKRIVLDMILPNPNSTNSKSTCFLKAEKNTKILIKTDKEFKVIKTASNGRKMFSLKSAKNVDMMYLDDLEFPKKSKPIITKNR